MTPVQRLMTAAGVITAFLPVVLFRTPANTVRNGDELAALSWVLAESRGDGCWQLYPMIITVEIGEMVTSARIVNCGKTTPPGPRIPEGIPFPLDYVQGGNNVTIIFSEVPQ
ncbi:MAG: hypothetical protein GY852_09005 [bacterium]|nr:hypothetical protein [bacterium]